MSDQVDVVLAHPYGEHNTGEILSLDPDDARRLVQAAAARYAEDEPADEALAAPGTGEVMVSIEATAGGTETELPAGDGSGTALPPVSPTTAHPAAWHALDQTGELPDADGEAPPTTG